MPEQAIANIIAAASLYEQQRADLAEAFAARLGFKRERFLRLCHIAPSLIVP